jgi:hypothetical protein
MAKAVLYQSVNRGFSHPDGSEPITYFGVSFRIPRSDHATVRQLEWEVPPAELCETLHLKDGRTLEPVLDDVIERFETIDQQSGDVLVMYRIPYRTT